LRGAARARRNPPRHGRVRPRLQDGAIRGGSPAVSPVPVRAGTRRAERRPESCPTRLPTGIREGAAAVPGPSGRGAADAQEL